MTFKNLYTFLLCLFYTLSIGCSSTENEPLPPNEDNEEDKPVVYVPSAKGITDMVLLYHTHPSRSKWTPDQIKHYIYRPGENGKPEWMFDGFLFVEFKAEKNGATYCFDESEYWNPADKNLWKWLSEETFAEGRGPNALEEILTDLADQGYTPPYKRQVVFGLPNPVYMFNKWGILNNKRMDFSKQEDRVAAVKWYIELILNEWKKKDYKYLDLGGFYWTKENLNTKTDDSAFLREVSKIIKEKGYDFSWIPYYGAEGSPTWKDHGFDIAYQQPNHFFSTETPDWFLPESIRFAKDNGLYMEMEFDERVAKPEFAERFYKYLDQFEIGGVWENMPVAYYHGDSAWTVIAKSKVPELMAMHKRLGDLLSKRQGKFSKIIEK